MCFANQGEPCALDKLVLGVDYGCDGGLFTPITDTKLEDNEHEDVSG